MALAQELHHSCRRLQGCVHTHIHSPRSLPAKHPTPSHHLASRSHKIAPMLFQGHSRIFKVLQGPSRSPQRSLDMSARLTLFSAIFMIERCDEMQACHANMHCWGQRRRHATSQASPTVQLHRETSDGPPPVQASSYIIIHGQPLYMRSFCRLPIHGPSKHKNHKSLHKPY